MNKNYKAKRNREILLNYEAGQTYKELAWVYQVSPIRIRQIINKEINLRNMKTKKTKEKRKFAVERGERLKREIKKRKYTQGAFAKELGISLSGLTYLLSGRSPIDQIMAYAIEHKFKIGSNYILHGTGKKRPKSEIINRLDQIYESLWSLDNQEQLMKTLNMFSELIVKQTEHAEKQVDLLKRIEAHFDAQLDKPETEIRFS